MGKNLGDNVSSDEPDKSESNLGGTVNGKPLPEPKQERPFRLVSDDLSSDTIEALEELLEQAKVGELIGVAFVAMYKKRRYIVNATGEAYRNPTFSRGMVAALDDALAHEIGRWHHPPRKA